MAIILGCQTRRRIQLVGVVLILAFAKTGRVADEKATTKTDFSNDNWRSRQMCGVNACYTYLKLRGCNLDYQVLKQEMPPKENGSTLADLLEATHKRGVRTKLVRGNIAQLSQLPLPAIAHLEEESTASFAASERGHYVVIVALHREAEEDHIEYIDGTTGRLQTRLMGEFFRQWSGYLLLADTSHELVAWKPIILVCLAVTVSGVLYFAKVSTRKWHGVRAL